MKRSGPPQRKTPLARGKQLDRGKGLHSGSPLPRSGPVKPKRDTPRRRDRDDVDHGIPWPSVRKVILLRANGRCEVCTGKLTLDTLEGHHRLTRRLGPDCPCNAIAVCHDCHHYQIHKRPEAAKDDGRIISRHDDRRPSDVPVLLAVGERLLTCAGTMI